MHKDGKITDGRGGDSAEILLPLPPVQNQRLPLQPQKLEQWEEKPGLHQV